MLLKPRLPSYAGSHKANSMIKIFLLLVRPIFHFCRVGKHKPAKKHLTAYGQEASLPRPPCNGKQDALVSAPSQSVPPVGIYSNTNTPLHKLQIKVPRPITLCLLLSWLAIALLLTGLSGDLQQFQWLLLATLSGALSQAIAIIFGGTAAWPVVLNDSKLNRSRRKSSTEQQQHAPER